MEETHYSTSEELQATLQELNDLQEQVHELQTLNEQLELDKVFLLETLCTHSKKLESYCSRMNQMQKLMLEQYDKKECLEILNPSEREEQLVQMLKESHQEKEELIIKKSELTSTLEELRNRYSQFEQNYCSDNSLLDKFRYVKIVSACTLFS